MMPSGRETMNNEVFPRTGRVWHRNGRPSTGRKRFDPRRGEQGFTLLEVLVLGFLVGLIVASSVGYSLDPYRGNPDRYVRWQITDENATRKRIQLVVGERASIWGPPREIVLDTFRTDIQ